MSYRVLAVWIVATVSLCAQVDFSVRHAPGTRVSLADDYRPDPVQRADGGSIATAPFWSSYWLDSDQLTDRSKTPAPPARLLKQDPGRGSEWAPC